MAEYADLEMNIERNYIRFRVDGADYQGSTDFSAETLTTLQDMCSFDRSWEEYGVKLFQATFREGARRGYERLRNAVESGKRYRLRLNINPELPELHRLCWECLYDPQPPPRKLSCGLSTPMSRYLCMGVTRQPIAAEKVRILVVVSNPEDLEGGKWASYPRLDEPAERQVIQEVLDELKQEGRVYYDWQDKPASPVRIRERLYREGFHILHIVGHGGFVDGRGHLLLEKDEDQTVEPVTEQDLAMIVEDMQSLQLVVLAACSSAQRTEADVFGGLAPRLVEYGVPAVVAMQQRVEQETARLFTRAFYEALLKSTQTKGLMDAAVNAARDSLYFRQNRTAPWAWTIPVLFMRGDGRLFATAPEAPAATGGGGPEAEMYELFKQFYHIMRVTRAPAEPRMALGRAADDTLPGLDAMNVRNVGGLASAQRQVLRAGATVSPAVSSPTFQHMAVKSSSPGGVMRGDALRVK